MPEDTVILPTPTPYKHFIPTPTPFVSVIATPSVPASLGIVETEPGGVPQADWALAAFTALGISLSVLNRLVRRAR